MRSSSGTACCGRFARRPPIARQLRYWDLPFLDAGAEVVGGRLRVLDELAAPLRAAHAEIAPDEADAGLAIRYVTNVPRAPGESIRDALERRLAETAEKEVWNGTTLVGPHRDDLAFALDGRDLANFASRGQQRTAILAFKLAELDLLTSLDGGRHFSSSTTCSRSSIPTGAPISSGGSPRCHRPS